jgi:3-dehydroquinate synthetase
MGIVAMLKPSMEYGLSMEETQKIIDLFQSLSLDIQWEKWRDQALPYISTDKKTIGKEIFEIYLKGIGNAVMIKQSILILNNQFNS